MNMLVSGAALASASVVPATGDHGDIIFDAIHKHREALEALHVALREHAWLEGQLPKDKQRSETWGDEITIVETDDPRWIASLRELMSTSDAETEAACAILDVRPTTTLGLVRLLRYATDHVEAGHEWPSDLTEGDSKRGYDWFYFLTRNVTESAAELRWPDASSA